MEPSQEPNVSKPKQDGILDQHTHLNFRLENRNIAIAIGSGILALVATIISAAFVIGSYKSRIDYIEESQKKLEETQETINKELVNIRIQNRGIEVNLNAILFNSTGQKPIEPAKQEQTHGK